MSRVILSVAGTIYEISKTCLENHALYKLIEHRCRREENGENVKFTIDRPSECFGAIITYLQTGELHMPTGVCPGLFRSELEYWNIHPHCLKECCLYRFQAFLDDEETRHKFLENALTIQEKKNTSNPNLGTFERYRLKVWNLVDNNEVSIPARIYFITVSLMVILSILSLALSTEDSMRRGVSECELLEYMEYTDDPDLKKVEFILGYPDCSGSLASSSTADSLQPSKYNWIVFEFRNGTLINDFKRSPRLGLLQIQNALIQNPISPKKFTIDMPNLTVPIYAFHIIDIILIVFFSIDLVLRIFSCPSPRYYLCSPINVFDVLALLGSYASMIILSVEKQYRYIETPWLSLLNFLLVFRALRLFRIVKNVRASKVLAYSLTQNGKDMSLLVLLLFVGISAFACLFYFSETRDTVSSIPVAWYWAIVTMTTVGYGDISPSTGLGRGLAALCAICGVLLLAITLPMFVNNFLCLYQYSCVNESIEKSKGKRDKQKSHVVCPTPRDDNIDCTREGYISSKLMVVKSVNKESEILN
ncbi:hypothetical protein ACF0H5_019620 [Mactra antiquata]